MNSSAGGMGRADEDGKCPVCNNNLPVSTEENPDASETHIEACIAVQMADLDMAGARVQPPVETVPPYVPSEKQSQLYSAPPEKHLQTYPASSYSTEPMSRGSEWTSGSGSTAMHDRKALQEKMRMFAPEAGPSSTRNEKADLAVQDTMQAHENHEGSSLRKWFSSMAPEKKSKEEKMSTHTSKADQLMQRRWGGHDSLTYEMAMRYIVATRMREHWEYLGAHHPHQFEKYLIKGYMEPIPTAWVKSRKLAWQYPEGSYYENPAEKRLYYLLNNGVMPDGSKHKPLRPLNIVRDRHTIIRRGNERNARQQRLDSTKLAAYRSAGDVFHNDKQIKSHNYSDQVTNRITDARQKALHELADGIIHGTDHLETMLLIDVSGSMTWNPHQGIPGPDGVCRYHDQPSNINLVKHLVHRVLHHMILRAQREHPTQLGIDTVQFSTYGTYVGQLSANNFYRDWHEKIRLGGGTQVMQGWQAVKNTYFQHQHTLGHGMYDDVYGWQPTPGMPKLSLLVFLDGEATDMDEFELELLGETWAYVTIALVGMENCPHHHSHAIELERVATFNPHVAFYDCHGRVCERMVVEELLSQVYPVDAPSYEEILKPEYDLPSEEPPAYFA